MANRNQSTAEVNEIQQEFTINYLTPTRCSENLDNLEKVLEAALFFTESHIVTKEHMESVHLLYGIVGAMREIAGYDDA
jgi:hypothetical protein